MSQRSKLLTATAIAFLLLGTGCSKTDNTNNTKTDSTEKEKEKETETTVSVENQIAFTELTLIDGVSTTAKPNHTVIIDTVKGTIVDVFESNTKTLNENLKVENMQGKTMMPGLIEGHFHLASGVEEDTKEGESSLKNMFRQGITTVRDMAGNGTALKNLKQMAQAPETTYPKVYFVSLIIGQDFIDNDPRVKSTLGSSVAGEVPWFNALDDATAVEALIEEAKAYGCSGLKLYADITGDNAKRIIAAAKKLKFPVWAHGTLFPGSPWDIEGVHSFSHSPYLAYVPEETVPSLAETFDEDYTYPFDLEAINSAKMTAYFQLMKENDMVLDATAFFFENFGPDKPIVQYTHNVTKKVYEAGVRIGAGTDFVNDDVGPEEYILLQEIKSLHQFTGMTKMEALQTATINNAMALGIAASYGSIEVGKKADIILLDKNPLDALEDLKTVTMVIKDGYIHRLKE